MIAFMTCWVSSSSLILIELGFADTAPQLTSSVRMPSSELRRITRRDSDHCQSLKRRCVCRTESSLHLDRRGRIDDFF